MDVTGAILEFRLVNVLIKSY